MKTLKELTKKYKRVNCAVLLLYIGNTIYHIMLITTCNKICKCKGRGNVVTECNVTERNVYTCVHIHICNNEETYGSSVLVTLLTRKHEVRRE